MSKKPVQNSPFSIRLDPEKLDMARELNIDVAELFRKKLDREIAKRAEGIVCEFCGHHKKIK